MSQRVSHYEGTGKHRRPVYIDEGPATAAAADRMAALDRVSLMDVKGGGLPLGGASTVERRQITQAEIDARRASDDRASPIAARPPNILERLESALTGGPIHTPPPPEEETVSRAPIEMHIQGRTIIPEIIPEPVGDTLGVLADAVVEALEANTARVEAETRWLHARAALDAAYRALDVPSASPDLTPSTAVREDAHASVAPDGESQAAGELSETVQPSAQPVAQLAPTPEAAPPAAGRPTLTPRRVARVDGGLTVHEQRILDAVLAHDGDRKPVAIALHTSDANVVATLERIGKRGLLPIGLIAKLPARFAKYTGV